MLRSALVLALLAATVLAGGCTGRGGAPAPADPERLPRVPAEGALLAPPRSLVTFPGPATLTCQRLEEEVQARLVPERCGAARLAPSNRPTLWVAGRQASTDALALEVWAHAGDRWTLALTATEEPAGAWQELSVHTPVLTKDGQALLAAARRSGSGGLLSYDLVHAPDGQGRLEVVAHRGDLAHGAVQVITTSEGPALEDYAADFSDGAPTCCPNRFTRTRIAYRAGAMRVLNQATVEPSQVPGWRPGTTTTSG